jgi:hypothetical protein
MNYPKPDYKPGVLVYADGRTTALDSVIGAEWWVQSSHLDSSLPTRYFRLADVAYRVASPEHPVFVYTERPESDYRKHLRHLR